MKKTLILAAVAVAMLLSAVPFASAAPVVVGSGVPGDVTVQATVNSKLTLTISTDFVDFGAVDPGATYSGKSVSLNVKSNRPYDLTEAISNPAGSDEIVVSSDFVNVAGAAKTPSQNYVSNFSLDVPFDAAPGVHQSTVTYTATQL